MNIHLLLFALLITGSLACDLEEIAPVISSGEFECGQSFTDPRDGNTYATVWIDEDGGHDLNKPGLCWMAESLDFDTGFSRCHDDVASRCTTYGRIYASPALANICPNGWRIPSSEEWSTLFRTYGWAENLTGNGPIYSGNIAVFTEGGNSGMNLLAGGSCFNNDCEGIDQSVSFWAADNSASAFFGFSGNGSVWAAQFQGNFEYYIRCVKNP